jgi:ribonuclease-3
MDKEIYKKLEKQIGYKFKNKNILNQALTHSSFSSKNNNERLEFLGDRVLGLIIAKNMYLKYPKEAEGDLAKRHTSLVCKDALLKISDKLNLSYYTQYNTKNKSKFQTNHAIFADTIEALLGAIYLDSNLKNCEKFILKFWDLEEFATPQMDAKSTLQEWAQSKKYGLPKYTLTAQEGTEHSPIFHIQVSVNNFDPIQGSGLNKKEAEKNAAENFLNKYCEK